MSAGIAVTGAGSSSVWPLVGASAASSGASGLFGYLGGRRQRQHQTQMMHDAQAHEIGMWQMQADYNHPLNQMGRLQQAGLNPHLIYGQSARDATGIQRDYPKAHPPSHIENEFANMQMPMFQELILKAQEIRNMKEGAELIHAQNRATQQDINLKRLEHALGTKDLMLKAAELQGRIEEAEHNTWRSESDAKRAYWEAKGAMYDTRMKELLNSAGLTESDHVGFRMIMRLLDVLGIKLY